MKLDLTKEFNVLVSKCDKKLLDDSKVSEIIYITKNTSDAQLSNAETLNELLKDGGNIYALWIKKLGSKKWELMYIGQRKSKYIRTRFREHLFKKDERTGSQLDNIREQLRKKCRVGMTVIKVEPDVLRHSVEEHLIFSERQKGKCLWNKQG